MKKRSANAERRRRLKKHRAHLRERFKSTSTDKTIVNLPQEKNLALIFNHKIAAISCAMILVTLLNITTILNLSQRPAPANSVTSCQLSNPEQQTQIPAKDLKIKKTSELSQKIAAITKNTPMAKMVDEISEQDQAVAAFVVGIAMKESKFGLYAPKKNGVDCYNYWGYRGKENTTASGYSCFDSPSHAVKVISKKIASMVKQGAKTPAHMISWKCGSTCAGHDPASVTKWISDVAINYYRLNPGKELAKRN